MALIKTSPFICSRGEQSTIHLTQVEALNVTGLRTGNIIFDIVLIGPDKLTLEDIKQVYDVLISQTRRSCEVWN